MENWKEFLVPLIFAAIYFFGNIMSKGEEGGTPTAPRRDRSPDDDEAAERQRKIQEEIRRKIMERRQAAQRDETATSPPKAGRQSDYDRQLLERRESRNQKREVSPAPVPQQSPQTPSPIAKEADDASGTYSWEVTGNAYETQIEEQLRQIEATKRKAEQLKKQAAKAGAKATDKRTARNKRTVAGPVRQQLQDPAAARAAFIYAEVLGQPISMKKQSSVPGLS